MVSTARGRGTGRLGSADKPLDTLLFRCRKRICSDRRAWVAHPQDVDVPSRRAETRVSFVLPHAQRQTHFRGTPATSDKRYWTVRSPKV
jgi:hypothetical protein